MAILCYITNSVIFYYITSLFVVINYHIYSKILLRQHGAALRRRSALIQEELVYLNLFK